MNDTLDVLVHAENELGGGLRGDVGVDILLGALALLLLRSAASGGEVGDVVRFLQASSVQQPQPGDVALQLLMLVPLLWYVSRQLS